MSENITPDEFGWKLDTYQEVGEQSFGDGDMNEGVTLTFRNPTAPLALINYVAEVIDYTAREPDPSRERMSLPYAVDERFEFVVFPNAEAMEAYDYDEAWQEYVHGEGGYIWHESIQAAKREAINLVQFSRNNPAKAFQWDGTAAGFKA
jgi:hypothetical protein